MRRYKEEKKLVTKPALTVESGYHFPELGTLPEVPSKMPKPPKDMITTPIIIPVKKETTLLSLKLDKGKLVSNASSFEEEQKVIVKKPTYNSWASVLKPKSSENVSYEVEEKIIPVRADIEKIETTVTIHTE
jgi:hypothetical protein